MKGSREEVAKIDEVKERVKLNKNENERLKRG